MYATALDRIPGPLAARYEAGQKMARTALSAVLTAVSRKPTAGWGLRRGMVVHGADTPLAYVEQLKDFRLAAHAPSITCPTLVTYGEGDEIGASAPQLFEALAVPDKALIHFTAAEGGGDHCEQGARTLFDACAFGWLDERREPATLG